jgi:hypothetical protein
MGYLRTYAYDAAEGLWLSAFDPGGMWIGRRMLFVGELADIARLDRDDDDLTPIPIPGTPAVYYEGPFWEEDTLFRGRAPFGVGRAEDDLGAPLPDSVDWRPGVKEGQSVLNLRTADVPEHAHGIAVYNYGTNIISFVAPSDTWTLPFARTNWAAATSAGGGFGATASSPTTMNFISGQNTSLPGGDVTEQVKSIPHQSAGVGTYVLKRTGRIWYAEQPS